MDDVKGAASAAPSPEPDYRTLLLQFVASLRFADHLGDVVDDARYVLKKAGVAIEEYAGLEEIADALAAMGVTTLYGTSLSSDDEDADGEK